MSVRQDGPLWDALSKRTVPFPAVRRAAEPGRLRQSRSLLEAAEGVRAADQAAADEHTGAFLLVQDFSGRSLPGGFSPGSGLSHRGVIVSSCHANDQFLLPSSTQRALPCVRHLPIPTVAFWMDNRGVTKQSFLVVREVGTEPFSFSTTCVNMARVERLRSAVSDDITDPRRGMTGPGTLATGSGRSNSNSRER